MKRHVANIVTASRGLSGPVVAWLLVVQHAQWWAFGLFTFAAFTDLYDGWLSRRFGGNPAVGELLDPLADKLLAGFSWWALWQVGWAPAWLAGFMLARHLLVAVVWGILSARGVRIAATPLAQITASFEGASLGILLFHGPFLDTNWPLVGAAVGLESLILSAGSVLGYLVIALRGLRAR